MMQDLDKPLSNGELRELDDFLLDRVDEEAVRPGDDEGILGVSELDGLMTAMVSVPNTILPSRWWPLVWGDFEPVFDSTEQMERFFALAYRHMNGIAFLLMGSPDDFEPLFIERKVDGRTSTVVDEWCEGYMRGVALAVSLGAELDEEVETMLLPVMAFTEALDWPGHELPDREAIEELQQAIAPCVRALHAYWLERRQETPGGPVRSYRRGAAKVGRNDPCPCGSGKKYKKCCMR